MVGLWDLQQSPPIHVCPPTRPNWGGGTKKVALSRVSRTARKLLGLEFSPPQPFIQGSTLPIRPFLNGEQNSLVSSSRLVASGSISSSRLIRGSPGLW